MNAIIKAYPVMMIDTEKQEIGLYGIFSTLEKAQDNVRMTALALASKHETTAKCFEEDDYFCSVSDLYTFEVISSQLDCLLWSCHNYTFETKTIIKNKVIK